MNRPYHCPMPLDAIGALALGQKIEAIHIVRKEKALSLKEAKALVEAYERDNPDLYPQQATKHPTSKLLWLGLGAIFGSSALVTWVILNTH